MYAESGSKHSQRVEGPYLKDKDIPKFKYTALVERTVKDTVTLRIDAESEVHAQAIAEGVLSKFPEPHSEDEFAVRYCYIDNRDYGTPKILSMEESRSD